MRFLIVGTPRSGTTFAGVLMANLGIDCAHEWALKPTRSVADSLRWFRSGKQAESCWMGWIAARMIPNCDLPILHTVRNPWRVIDSLVNRNSILNDRIPAQISVKDSIRETIEAFMPGLWDTESKIERAARFVVGWNRSIADSFPERFVYEVESLTVGKVAQILDYVGADVPDADVIDAALERAKTDQNSGLVATQTDMTPDQIAAAIDNHPDLLQELNSHAAAHGYETVEAGLAFV